MIDKVYGVFFSTYAHGPTWLQKRDGENEYSRLFLSKRDAKKWANSCNEERKKWSNDPMDQWFVKEMDIC